ncbi:unnamed protein product [Amoebophrya sp. A25]|nr:unnamed protein product [Amoebophrya sp. A25]|eukprot:GSA25T00004309001.1
MRRRIRTNQVSVERKYKVVQLMMWARLFLHSSSIGTVLGAVSPPSAPLEGYHVSHASSKGSTNSQLGNFYAGSSVVTVERPLTRKVADEVTALLSGVGRTEEAKTVAKLLGAAAADEELTLAEANEEGTGTGLPQLTSERAEHKKGEDPPVVVLDEVENIKILGNRQHSSTSTPSKSSKTSTDKKIITDHDQQVQDPHAAPPIVYFREPELASENVIEDALVSMQRRQLVQMEERIGQDEAAARDIERNEVTRKQREIRTLELQIERLRRDISRAEERASRKRASAEQKREQAERIRGRIGELTTAMQDARAERAKEMGRQSAADRISKLLLDATLGTKKNDSDSSSTKAKASNAGGNTEIDNPRTSTNLEPEDVAGLHTRTDSAKMEL